MVPELFRPSLFLPPAVMLAGLVASLGLTAWALLLRITDRTVPRWAGPAAALLLGLGMSGGIFGLADTGTAFDFTTDLAVVVIVVAVVASTRRFDLAGWVLLGAGVPALLWWGLLAAQDLLSTSVESAEPLRLWLAEAAAAAVLGVIGIRVGDRRADPSRPPAHQPDPSRAVSLVPAMQRELRFGPVDVPNAAAFGVGTVVSIVTWIGAYALGAGELASAGLGILVLALVATELYYHAWPRRLRRALAAHAFLGSWEMKRFRATTGTRPPTSVAAAQRWLEANPETEANRWARISLLAWTGRLDEADAALARLPETTEAERFERHTLRVFLDIVAGRDADVEGLAAAAERQGAPGSDERLRAVTEAALAESRRRLAQGEGDWKGPLLAAQERIGDRSLGIIRTDTWRQRFAATAVASASIVAVGWIIGLVAT